jgi:hypothetical protein
MARSDEGMGGNKEYSGRTVELALGSCALHAEVTASAFPSGYGWAVYAGLREVLNNPAGRVVCGAQRALMGDGLHLRVTG